MPLRDESRRLRLSVCLPWLLSLVLALGWAGFLPVGADTNRRPRVRDWRDIGNRVQAAFPAQVPGQTSADLHRSLGSSSSSEDDATGHTAGEHDTSHFALVFMFLALLLGTLVMQISSWPLFHGLQYTVVMFVLGVLWDLIAGLLKGTTTQLSHDMWMAINPHLLLFTMLPALLMGDAMSIDTSVVQRVALQCLYMAGPGVLINTFLTAFFLWAYLGSLYNWPFLLCTTLGSILAATDPVAVVGLLKELGASPSLTVQIQGESLLNDGTAIVTYNVAYRMLKGEIWDVTGIVIYLVESAGFALGLGFTIGWVAVIWIRSIAVRHHHNNSIMQISITICCAYTSFFVAEGMLHLSGVLSTVASALVLADNMWPAIQHREAMENVWHFVEFVGNTVIFFLAGSLTADAAKGLPWQDYLHCVAIYVVCVLVRGALIFASRPILRRLSKNKRRVRVSDALVMTWGGLRGAVGLALAIQVSMEHYTFKSTVPDAKLNSQRVLFYVAGIATLTLLVNATSAPALVRYLEITKTPAARERLLMDVHRQMAEIVDGEPHSHYVRVTFLKLLDRTKAEIIAESSSGTLSTPGPDNTSSLSVSARLKAPPSVRNRTNLDQVSVDELMNQLDAAKARLDNADQATLEVLDLEDYWTRSPVGDEARESLVKSLGVPMKKVAKAVNEVFLRMVEANYWDQIQNGNFVLGTNEQPTLLNSIPDALDYTSKGLTDLDFIELALGLSENPELKDDDASEQEIDLIVNAPLIESAKEAAHVLVWELFDLFHRTEASAHAGMQPCLQMLVKSTFFAWLMCTAIIVNAMFLFIQRALSRGYEDSESNVWLVSDIFFACFFTMEALLRISAFRCQYFQRRWDLFDFLLVLLGWASILCNQFAEVEVGGQASFLLRLEKILRVLRMLRLVRLVRFAWLLVGRLLQKKVSLVLAEHVEKITILQAFARAHLESQREFLNFFGREGHIQSCEAAQCLLMSQTSVCRALKWAVEEVACIDRKVLRGMQIMHESEQVADRLEKFVERARQLGAVTPREAEKLVESFENHKEKVHRMMRDEHMGICRETFEDVAQDEDSEDGRLGITDV